MTKTTSLLLSCCFMAGMTSGCIDLNPPPNLTQYFVLGSTESTSPGEGLVLEIGKVVLAPYLDGPYIVTRKGPNEIEYSQTQRWGEDLKGNITRVVSTYLMAQENVGLATRRSVGDDAPDYIVDIHVERFEALYPDTVRFVARWFVRDGETRRITTSGQTVSDTKGWIPDDYADLTAKLDDSLRIMAEQIAATL